MKNLITQIFIIFVLFSLTSCQNKKDEPLKLRVVSLQGKAKPVEIKTPDLNVEALREQGKSNSYSSSHYVETPLQDNRAVRKTENYSNEFYDNKYNKNGFDNINSQQQEVVYRSDFNEQNNEKTDVKYILDTNSKQGKNPIIIQESSNVKTIDDNDNQTVEIDLSNNAVVEKTTPKEIEKTEIKKEVKKIAPKVNKNGYFVQVGAFKNKRNADRSLAYMKKFNKGLVQNVTANSEIKYKVILGPFSKRSSAQIIYNKIKKSGHDALIIRTSY